MQEQTTPERRQEIKQLAERWPASKLTQQEYCERENIPLHLFKYWRTKQLAKQKEEAKSKAKGKTFIPVELHAVPSTAEYAGLELEYPNGVKLHCKAGMKLSALKTLITLY